MDVVEEIIRGLFKAPCQHLVGTKNVYIFAYWYSLRSIIYTSMLQRPHGNVCMYMCMRASVRVTRKRGNSSLIVGTRISDNDLETVGNGTEMIS